MKEIIQKENKILRKISKEVPLNKIGSKEINQIIEDMKKSLTSQEDGVAIAAPQIGVSLRIVVISGKTLSFIKGLEKEKEDMVLINPKIKKLSKEKSYMEEGCLSVRYLYGKVYRSKKATIEAYDQQGGKIMMGGSGILAQIFQHEIDHLDGVLFIDKAKDIEDIPPENARKK